MGGAVVFAAGINGTINIIWDYNGIYGTDNTMHWEGQVSYNIG